MWDFAELLPFQPTDAVSIAEGGTPLIECHKLAESLGVDRVFIKDETRNPTGSARDREFSLALTAAVSHDVSTVALASTGIGAHSACAYAGRANPSIEVRAFVPSRAGFISKAMINVHGGDMTVVGGRIGEASEAFTDNRTDNECYPLAPFVNPYRHDGRKTVLFEIIQQLDWTVPDVIIHPTGRGSGLIGAYKGALDARRLELIDSLPSLYAAQAAGCSPIVDAVRDGSSSPNPTTTPDTICGAIEIPDPIAGEWVIEAIDATDGGAVASTDDAILDAAVAVANNEGIDMAPSSAVAASAAWDLADRDVFDGDETVVLCNTVSGIGTADVLRSHLMGKGI